MSRDIKPGKRFLDRYVVRDVIAEGGMATIFRAFDERSGIDVAIKRLYTYYMDNEVIRARFVEEGRIQQMLVHPNIVKTYDIIELPTLAIVMEFVPGLTLDEYLAQRGPLDEKEILDIIIPIMSAVGFAHQTGIIHRDIKPSNIVVAKNHDGLLPKVMDFGVAKVKGGAKDLTATGTTVGTLHYMSPEQIVGSKSIDGRADIYSLGVTLYKLTTGEVPFNAPTEFALMMAQVEAPPLPPSKIRPGIAPEMEQIILKSMAKKPQDRFQTIREFTTALLNSSFAPSKPSVRDTVTDRIPLDILQYAMQADQVGQDRTGEMNLRGKLPQFDLDDSAQETIEISKLTMDVGDPTEELSASSIIKLSSRDLIESPLEIAAKTQELQPQRETTRPSRPSAQLSRKAGEDLDTESLAQRIRVADLQGAVVFDQSESRDLTAPKVSSSDYERVLGQARNAQASRSFSEYGSETIDDAQTFEKPSYRTSHPQQFDTSKPISDRIDFPPPSSQANERPIWQSHSGTPSSGPYAPSQPPSSPNASLEAGVHARPLSNDSWKPPVSPAPKNEKEIKVLPLIILVLAGVVILAMTTFLILNSLWN